MLAVVLVIDHCSEIPKYTDGTSCEVKNLLVGIAVTA